MLDNWGVPGLDDRGLNKLLEGILPPNMPLYFEGASAVGICGMQYQAQVSELPNRRF